MHVYFISHLFFLAYLLNIRLTKLRISFLLLKKKTDFRAFKKKVRQKKKNYTLPNEPFFILSKIQKRHNSHDMSVICVTFNLKAPYKYLTLPHLGMREILEHLRA